MLGAIIGDIVGSVYEWNNIKVKDFPFLNDKGFFTDDSVMTIAVADALLKGGSPDDFIDSMKVIGRQYPDSGYGGSFHGWIFSDDRNPYNSYGNGSAMRVAACAWYANSLEEAEILAKKSAEVTHNHKEGIKGAQATAAAIFLSRTGEAKEEIKTYLENKYGYDLGRTLDEIRPVYKFNETCQETVPEAIIAFLESKGFEDAIRNAISIGGDSDTIAAITGSIAEAVYGIPSNITTMAFHYMDDSLSAVINSWLDANKPIGAVIKKSSWKTEEFSKPHSVNMTLQFSETQLARIRHGLLPVEMEDKWFAYYENEKIMFHRSWTGTKIYEAEICRDNKQNIITELVVERDAEIYKNLDDEQDIKSFLYLLGKGILGLDVDVPSESTDGINESHNWSYFGRMIL